MDWSKAKNVLIIVFLALNMVLLYINYDTLSSGGSTSKEILADTDKILQTRGVKLNCKIPANVKGAILRYENTKIDKAEVIGKLLGTKIEKGGIIDGKEFINQNRSVIFKDRSFIYIDSNKSGTDISRETDAESSLSDFLKRLDLPFSEYILDGQIKKSSNGFELKYKHKYKGYFIFDDYINAFVDSRGVTKLEYRYSNVKDIDLNSGQKVVEPYQILIQASEIKDTGINSIEIGFKKDITDQDTKNSFDVLTWRIVLSNGSEKYYNAQSGKFLN